MDILHSNKEFNHFIQEEKDKCIAFLCSHYTNKLSLEDREDVFQEACIGLLKNIRERGDDLKDYNSSLSWYLLKICRNQAEKKIRDSKYSEDLYEKDDEETKGKLSDKKMAQLLAATLDEEYEEELREVREKIGELVGQLPHPCDKIFHGYYWDEDLRNKKEIAEVYGFKNDRVVITTHARCLDKFTKFLEKHFPELLNSIKSNKSR